MKAARIRRIATGIVILAAAGGLLGTSIYTVRPQQQAIVQRFGRVVRTGLLPGPHLKFPFPVERVRKVKVASVKRVGVGFEVSDEISGRIPEPERLHYLTADRNIICVQAMVQFAISQPVEYLFKSRAPEELVRAAAEAALTKVCARIPVEEAITVAKYEIQQKSMDMAQELLDSYGVGVRITAVNLQSVGPPDEVAAAFKDVIDAKVERKRLVNEAEGYRARVVLRARGEAEGVLSKARGYEVEAIEGAKGESGRFLMVAAEYENAPSVTLRRLYLEMIEEVLPRVRKMVVGSDGRFTIGVGGAQR